MKYLTGKDYPNLCKFRQSQIDHCAEMLAIDNTIMTGSYSYYDDIEAPCNLAYDRNLLHGDGCECNSFEIYIIDKNQSNLYKLWFKEEYSDEAKITGYLKIHTDKDRDILEEIKKLKYYITVESIWNIIDNKNKIESIEYKTSDDRNYTISILDGRPLSDYPSIF